MNTEKVTFIRKISWPIIRYTPYV